MAQAAKKADTPNPATAFAIKTPKIPAANVSPGGRSQRTREVLLPDGLTAADLNENRAMWSGVQANRNNALQKFDRVFIIGGDQSWCADAIVSYADDREVILAGIKIISLADRTPQLYQDEQYRVVSRSGAFTVERKRDGMDMFATGHFHTAELAANAARGLHPRKIVA